MVRMRYKRREEGFLELGSFFDGSNSDGVTLNETQPIIMRHDQRRVQPFPSQTAVYPDFDAS